MDYELLESAPDAFLIADDQGRIVFVNALTEQLFGYAPGELVGTSLDSLVPERYRLAHNHLGQYVAPTQPRVMGVGLELSARRKDGTEFAVEISSSPLQSPAGPRFISTIRDVTGRKMAEAERDRLTAETRDAERRLWEARERFESAFGYAPIGMALIDMGGHWIQVNNAFCRITGYPVSQLAAITFQSITHAADLDLDGQNRKDLIDGRMSTYDIEKRYRHAWGHYIWVLVTHSVVRDEDGQAIYLIQQVQDISERKELAKRLEYLVDHDFLTGLMNRRRFEQELTHQVERAERYGSPGALLIVDVDNFKSINDTLGHAAGDQLLKSVASLLRQRLRHTDFLARFGGDEFAVLLPAADADRTRILAEEIVKALSRETAVLADRTIHMTVSVGAVQLDQLTATQAMACADFTMYQAKEAGRNRFSIYRPGQKAKSALLDLTERIRDAVESDQFLLYGQPILDLERDELSSFELLLRLPGDAGEAPILPAAFLYVAERFGLIQTIDTWVVAHAIQLVANEMRTGRRLRVHVNLSGRSIGDQKFVAFVEQTLAESAIDPALLIFELTETAAIADIEEAKRFTSRLRAHGCGFALDDFGAGFGSFYYLKNFPFDYLKIDGEFIRGLATGLTDQLVVQSLVDIATGLGKKTVGEFVGDRETIGLLRDMGVSYAQGYYVGQPKPVAELFAV